MAMAAAAMAIVRCSTIGGGDACAAVGAEMGCAGSKEDDRSAVGGGGQTVDEATLAASLASGRKLFSNLQLSVSCSGLRNKDRGSLSDPFVVLKSAPDGAPAGVWTEVGRTEIIANSLDPHFVKLLQVTYHFERVQRMRVEVYDADSGFSKADSEKLDLSKQDFQGFVEFTLASVVGARGQTWEADLVKGAPPTAGRGRVRLTAEEVANSNALVQLDLHGTGLKPSVCPFLVLSRVGEMGPPTRCYKTEVGKVVPGKRATWSRISVPLSTLANGDPLRPLQIELFDYKKSGRHVLLGVAMVSVNDIIARSTSQTPVYLGPPRDPTRSPVPPPPQQSAAAMQSGPALHFDACALVPQPSFFDYIAEGGCALNFVVAIDYTASNGPVTDPSSLHYRHPSGAQLTPYAQAIQSVGQVLAFYDTDQQYPVYGFGGIPAGHSVASHCFSVNGNEGDPNVHGVTGILDAYYHSLNQVQLHGPTLFAPVVNTAAALAASSTGGAPSQQSYFVLLLLTDGLIFDLDQTIDAIVGAADTPLSIIIVGVGNEDFTPMRVLDADDRKLVSSRGKTMSRDIVQFVGMNEASRAGGEAFAREVLAELPRQLLTYFSMKGILPNPRAPPPPPMATK